ncbi:MAG: restriction endonuclease subunit S [bacterium]
MKTIADNNNEMYVLNTGDLKIDLIMPELYKQWLLLSFEECLCKPSISYNKVKKKEISNIGKLPVIDQGEKFISGYINDLSKAYKGPKPLIIFGDHTQNIKYVNMEFAIGADGTKILHPKSIFDIRFFYHYLCSLNFQSDGYSRHYKYLKQIFVPLPPLNEQKRIAAKLDHIMPRIDSMKERLERIPKIIKRFRQSVLSAAVTGKLTEKWREEHPEVESAEVLLKRIKKERERRYQDECGNASRQGGRKPKKYRVNNDPINIDDVVFKWNWERLVNIADISGGVTKGRNLNNYDCVQLPYLRVANVQDGYLDLKEIKKMKIKNNEKKTYLLKAGDILFTEGGDRDKLGRGTVWHNEIENCIHQNHVFKARVNLNDISPEYISLVTKSEYSKNYFLKMASQTVNLASINMTNLGDLLIPICPLEEQHEIVRQVDKLFSLADKLEKHYKRAKEKIDKLPQSVLSKAFRGELVPQDPNDEPAEKLMERILEEEAKMEAGLKASRKKVTRKKSC